MKLRRIAAIVFAGVSAVVVAFQIALALGAPWGDFAMGGAFSGQFPAALRVAAVVQAMAIALIAAVVLARAGLVLPGWQRASRWLIWVVVAFSSVSLVLNLITPSSGEASGLGASRLRDARVLAPGRYRQAETGVTSRRSRSHPRLIEARDGGRRVGAVASRQRPGCRILTPRQVSGRS